LCGAGLATEVDQPLCPAVHQGIVHGPRYLRAYAQHAGDGRQEPVVYATEKIAGSAEVEFLELVAVSPEVLGFRVVVNDGLPMGLVPGGIADDRVPDPLIEVPPPDAHRYSQPRQTMRRLDPIAIPPVPSRVAHVIKKDELIYHVDEVEIPFPRNVIRLNDGNALELGQR